jgi:hypothetical protein
VALDAINNALLMSPPVTVQELDRLHRVGPLSENSSDRAQPILLKFSTYRTRHRIYSRRKALYTEDENSPKLFLNEDLTKRRAQLLAKARALKKKKTIAGAWSADGRLFIKTNDGKVLPLHCEQDLRCFNPPNVAQSAAAAADLDAPDET